MKEPKNYTLTLAKPLLSGYLHNNLNSVGSVNELLKSIATPKQVDEEPFAKE